METTTRNNLEVETLSPLYGVLLYEDRNAYARALNLYAYLAVEVAKEVPMQFSWWAMRALNDPTHAATAKKKVQEADIVIVSARPAADWPRGFKIWVESWMLPKRKKLSALGGLFSPSTPELAEVSGRQAYLQYIAASLKLDFLAAAPESTAHLMKTKLGFSAAPPPIEPEIFNVVDRADYSPYCGING